MDVCNWNYLEKRLYNLLSTYQEKNVFTGASIAWSLHGKNKKSRFIYSFGKTDADNSSQDVKETTFFDLASLTKPLATVLSLLSLRGEGKIDFNDRLGNLLPLEMAPEKSNIKVEQLMNHSSGLPAHKPYYEKLLTIPQPQRREKILRWILDEKLVNAPGKREIYSDLDYILLSAIIDEITGEGLERYWLSRIAEPFGLEDTFCFSKEEGEKDKEFVTTGMCQWSGKKLAGTVHDDNCRALKGVYGHAGLFGTIEGVIKICDMIPNLFKKYIKERELDSFFSQKKKGRWVLGFDTPSRPYSSSGNYFSDNSIGHLGFTGTSFWMDLEKKVNIVFLTNRVCCQEDTKVIRELRPLVHDLLMKEILEH